MSTKPKHQSKINASNTSKASSTNVTGINVTSTAQQVGSKKPGATALNNSNGPVKPSQIQVIFNGKIVTPQSLLPRKDAAGHTGGKKSGKGYDANHSHVPTIDESADNADKTGIAAKMRGKIMSVGSILKSGANGLTNDASMSALRGKFAVQKDEEYSTIRLEETETTIQFALTSFISPSDIREIKEVEERNAKYDAIVQAHKNTDNYMSHPTQTMNNPLKNQNDMAAPNAVQDFECQADPYDIKDNMIGRSEGSNDPSNLGHVMSPTPSSSSSTSTSTGTGMDFPDIDDGTGFSLPVRKFILDTVGIASVSPGCMLDPSDLTRARNPTDATKDSKPKDDRKHRVASKNTAGVSKIGTDSSRGDNDVASKSYAVDPSQGKSQGGSDYNVVGGNLSNDGRSEMDGTSESGFLSDPNVNGQGTAVSNNNGPSSAHHGSAQSAPAPDMEELLRERQAQQVLSAPLLLKRLQLLERAVQQNAFHRQHLDYRDLPDLTPLKLTDSNGNDGDDAKDALFGGFAGLGALNKRLGGTKPGINQIDAESSVEESTDEANEESKEEVHENVKLLFRYTNIPLVQGRSVTSMAWNAVNTDLLAVGYGKLDTFVDDYKPGTAVDEELAGGLVLFWSLRNPDYPEKILRTPHPVTALEFSKLSPMILAVGLMNGDVSVYDVKREFNWTKPIETSENSQAGHADPVWQVKWVVKGIERFETLVSISTDGSVLEWNLKKGLVVSTLMQLKRSGAVEGWISRTAAGLCFDFIPSDPNTYVVGTEEGALHRCSVSYSEQYLDSYEGHDGPVYRVRFSTRWPQLFLTSSADWKIHVYHVALKTPLLTLRTTNEDFAINDICWCPGNSTIFAAVTANSKLEIWDLSVSSIDPVALIDTSRDEELLLQSISSTTQASQPANNAATDDAADGNLPPATPTSSSPNPRYESSGNQPTASTTSKEQPVTKLLKNLTSLKTKRELTCVQFNERSPTLAVGDNRGTVMVYRVISPLTITHEGPLQQTMKLKSAISLQVDPTTSSRLSAIENAATRHGERDPSSLPSLPPSGDNPETTRSSQDVDSDMMTGNDAEYLPAVPPMMSPAISNVE